MENLNKVVADNLIFYRKNAKMTQIELAEKLNYSDKAISKWERGETVPDLFILTTLAGMYGITVNDFLQVKKPGMFKGFSFKKTIKNQKVLISLLCSGMVWLLATIAFVCCLLLQFHYDDCWKLYIYAIPVSFLVTMILAIIWRKPYITAVLLSIVVWGTFLSIFCSVTIPNIWLVFIIAIPIQIIIILGCFLIREVYKMKSHKTSINDFNIKSQ